MKYAKPLSAICAFALVSCMISGCTGENNSSEKNMTSSQISQTEESSETTTGTTAALTSETAKLVGRTYLDDDTLWVAFSGAGAEFVYTGKKLEITIVGDNAATAGNADNYARVAIYVDGERVVDDMLDQKEKTYTAFESNEAKSATVQIVKLSECIMSTFGIKPIKLAEGEKIEPTAARDLKIEFIGDSITCGYGVDDEDKEHHFKTSTEDVTKAYAYKTAQQLDADYSIVSISGYGVISGYSADGKKVEAQTIPQYYDKLGFSYYKFADSTEVATLEWDFDSFTPDVVVINLGANDASYAKNAEKKAEFEEGYIEFLKQVRSHNPDAFILCTYGVMGPANLIQNIRIAVYKYTKQTGDENIRYFMLDAQNEAEDGIAADWHPSAKTHDKCAEQVVEKIKEYYIDKE